MPGASANSPRKPGRRLLPLPRPPASAASAPGAAAANDPEHLREQLAAAHAQIANLRWQQQAILTVECVVAVCVSCAIRSTHARTQTHPHAVSCACTHSRTHAHTHTHTHTHYTHTITHARAHTHTHTPGPGQGRRTLRLAGSEGASFMCTRMHARAQAHTLSHTHRCRRMMQGVRMLVKGLAETECGR